jgi:hypothetical protein
MTTPNPSTYEAFIAYSLYDSARTALLPRWSEASKRYVGVGPDIEQAMSAYNANPTDENRNHLADLKRKQERDWREMLKLKNRAQSEWEAANLRSWSGARGNHDRWVLEIDRRNAELRRRTRINGEIAAAAARQQLKPEPEVQRLANAAWDQAFNAALKQEQRK